MENVLDNGKLQKLIVFMIILVMSIIFEKIPVMALENGEVSVTCRMPGVSFSLYKVADLDDQRNIVPVDELTEYKDSIDWTYYTAAYTLAGYVAYKNMKPVMTGVTNDSYQVTFKGLGRGLYLLCAANVKYKGNWYQSSPILFSLPFSENGQESMSVSINHLKDILVEEESLTIKKIWKGDEEKSRPSSIQVNLLKDGKLYETVKLNANNKWTYTWDDLDPFSDWKAVENLDRVGEDYKVSNIKSGDTIKITNQWKKKNTHKTTSALPQTGLLWWPVIIMACLGIIFLLTGKIFRSGKK